MPLRLRERARVEVSFDFYLVILLFSNIQMDPVRKKALGRAMPKRGKVNRINRTDTLLRRQSQFIITTGLSTVLPEILTVLDSEQDMVRDPHMARKTYEDG